MQPLAVRLPRRELPLDLVVSDDAAVLGVDEEHLAGLEPAALHHAGRIEVEHTRLGGEDDEPVVGDAVPPRTKTVAVEHGAHEGAVGETDVGRAVPGLHEHRVELVEGTTSRIHQLMVLPRLRDHHQDRVRQRPTAEVEQLEHLVEAGRVRRPRRADREEPLEVTGDDVGREEALSGPHPVPVALDRVDLTVVGDEAVRVRQWPRREGVGREPGVDERELGREAGVRQIREERLELPGGQHSLVDHGACGERGEVDLHLALGALAQPEGETVEPECHLTSHGGADEELLEVRHARAGRLADEISVDGHLPPAEDLEVLLDGELLDPRLGRRPSGGVGGQEGEPSGIRPGVGEGEGHDRAEERVRNLGEDAGTVTHERVGSGGATVVEVAQRGQRVVDDVVAGRSPHRRDERDPAGVVLELAAVQPGVLRLGTEQCARSGVRRHLHRPSGSNQSPGMTKGTWTALATSIGEKDTAGPSRPTY